MWFLVLRRAVQPRDQWTASLDEHLGWMREQHEAGAIVMSGPSGDRTPGIYLVRAASRQAVEAIASGDPFNAADHCTFDLIEWHVHQILGMGPFSAAELSRSRD